MIQQDEQISEKKQKCLIAIVFASKLKLTTISKLNI